ncbi:SWIM zinc finger family protein, partial [Neosynechococcus sphagnicola]|uniref:SWIM zinc finger family protein n=1 Tax=Neosynechococcus sphagnicola TaxID=1501145 RepID=UPI001EF9EE1F
MATLGKWLSLGSWESVLWGECQGSGKDPYQTQIELGEPAFRCSCPSRKFPCKHGLGLLLLLAEQSSAIAATDPPEWVAAWLASRSQRAEKQAEKRVQEQVADPTAQAKRVAERQRKVHQGLQDLRRWLEDRVRQGLATMPQESYQVWDTIAARMVDAQAPGLARQLRDLAGIAQSGQGWIDRCLEQLGRIYLLIEGFERLETLSPEVQADLRTQIGWSLNQEEVLAGTAHPDLWLVVGQRLEEEDRLKIRRTWLLGLGSSRFALL